MTNQALIQLIPVGRMWRVYVNGVCRAFAPSYRAAQQRAAQLQGGAK